VIRIDSASLSKLIVTCFDLAGDDALSQAQRDAWMTTGKRLRGALLNILTAQFENGTAKVNEANEELKRINKSLKTAVDDLEKLKDELAAAKAMVGTLDSLLKLAIAFV